jgi:hypothetical protein
MFDVGERNFTQDRDFSGIVKVACDAKNTSSFLVAQGVWNQVLLPFPAFLLSLWSFWPVRKSQ